MQYDSVFNVGSTLTLSRSLSLYHLRRVVRMPDTFDHSVLIHAHDYSHICRQRMQPNIAWISARLYCNITALTYIFIIENRYNLPYSFAARSLAEYGFIPVALCKNKFLTFTHKTKVKWNIKQKNNNNQVNIPFLSALTLVVIFLHHLLRCWHTCHRTLAIRDIDYRTESLLHMLHVRHSILSEIVSLLLLRVTSRDW